MSNHVLPTGTIETTTQSPVLPDLAGVASAPVVSPIQNGMSALYGTADAAHAAAGAHLKSGQYIIVSAKKNNTKGAGVEDGWQVHCVVPSFAADIGTLGEWSDLVTSVLMKQASESLKSHFAANRHAREVQVSMFTAAQLREDFLSGTDGVSMTKEELERAFCASATWRRITGGEKFKVSSQYRAMAERFKSMVVQLAGRSTASLSEIDLDKILAKLEEEDLTTAFGVYVFRRIQKIKADRANQDDEIDIDSL